MYLADWVSTPVSVWPSGLASTTPRARRSSVEQVVGLARGQRELPHGHPQARREVHVPIVLHQPAALVKLAVDLLAGLLFGSHGSLPLVGPQQVGAASTSRDFTSRGVGIQRAFQGLSGKPGRRGKMESLSGRQP